MREKTILVAEDSLDDVFFIKRALKRAGITTQIHVVVNGQQAIEYLSGAGNFADRPRHPLPDILFLDLKMPIKDGFEVLEWVRSKPEFKELDVVILTSSAEPCDKERAQELSARAYIVKPPKPEVLKELLTGPEERRSTLH
jgi:CheY-like chemotaxis protein